MTNEQAHKAFIYGCAEILRMADRVLEDIEDACAIELRIIADAEGHTWTQAKPIRADEAIFTLR